MADSWTKHVANEQGVAICETGERLPLESIEGEDITCEECLELSCPHDEITIRVRVEQERYYNWNKKEEIYDTDSEYFGIEVISSATCFACDFTWYDYEKFIKFMENREN